MQHRDGLRDLPHHGEIVRDEQIGEPELLPQVAQQIENLALRGDVERAHRLVADQKTRLGGERLGDRDALALSARQLAGKTLHVVGAQPDIIQKLGDAVVGLRSRQPEMPLDHRADRGADGAPRIERRARVLKHHLHVAPE